MWQKVCRLLPLVQSNLLHTKKPTNTKSTRVGLFISVQCFNKNINIKKARSGNVGVYREMVRPWVARSWHSPRWAPSSWSSWPAPPAAAAVAVGRLPSSRPWVGLSPQPAAQYSQVHYYNLGPGVHIYWSRNNIRLLYARKIHFFTVHHTILGYRLAFV